MNAALRRWTFPAFVVSSMAKDFEKAVLRVVDESLPQPPKVLRLTSLDGVVTRDAPLRLPGEIPERLLPAEPSTIEFRTHEPDYEALAEEELISQPLEETWSEQNRESSPLPWGWFALIGLLFSSAVVWSMVHLQRYKDTPEAARTQAIQTFDKHEHERATALTTVERITAAVRSYCEADSMEKLIAVTRQPLRVRPLMEDWYGRHPLTSSQFVSLDLFQPMTLDRQGSFWIVNCTMQDKLVRHLLLEELPDKTVQVDWETEVCYQPMDWDRYVKERPAGSLDFRVWIVADNVHSHEFRDAHQWACYRLTTLHGELSLYGYVRRDSDAGKSLQLIAEQNGTSQSALLLRICTPTDLKSPLGVVIEKLLSPRWSYVEPPGS
jgi:hypothetical protein